ncbi:MAG: bifunctional DNA-formamidopyrimidine glycosylase/DNA-(apurinic or apyrimidinic site) lyase [Pseudohongiellaceae bacterium]
MPELPEVETTRNGIAAHLLGARVKEMTVRQRQLRWPVTAGVEQAISGQTISDIQRRGKYLLLDCGNGVLLIHLGMSGSLRIASGAEPVKKHDHVDIEFVNKQILRFHDPRKFGCMLWLDGDPFSHPLLSTLGPEPLSDEFSDSYLYRLSRKRKVPIKSFVMDSRVVVGVGNIYANEALFQAGIRPTRPAGTVSRASMQALVSAIKSILASAIALGGTTLRDFVGGDGKPGYFRQSLLVYGRAGLACGQCGKALREIRLGQRSTVYCTRCQG